MGAPFGLAEAGAAGPREAVMARGRARAWLGWIVRARSGQVALYGFSLLEAAFVPVPLEAVLAPYMQLRRDIIWRLAAIGLAGYLTVALVGYALGALFYERLAEGLIDAFGWRESFEHTRDRLAAGGMVIMIVLVALPIPTMIVHIGAGTLGLPIGQVIVAVLLVRGVRYFGTGLLVHRYGDRVVASFRRRAAARRTRRSQPPR